MLGKNKYISIKKDNKRKGIPNFVPYEKLSKHIREIDIGDLIPIEGTLGIVSKISLIIKRLEDDYCV